MAKVKKSLRKAKELGSILVRDVENQLRGTIPYVIGVDEAGRGPLAGPVVCAACFLPPDLPLIAGIKDSKLTTEVERETAFELLVNHPDVVYGVSIVSYTEIDQVNILQASMLGMSRATTDLLQKLQKSSVWSRPKVTTNSSKKSKTQRKTKAGSIENPNLELDWRSQFIGLVDGPYTPSDFPLAAVKPVIQGDRKVYSIAAASIIAKVTRDRIMVDYDRQYPVYLFAKHKGYPTAEHRSLLLQHGPCEIHRRSYNPVKLAIAAQEQREQRLIKKNKSTSVSEPIPQCEKTRKKRKSDETPPTNTKRSKKRSNAEESQNDQGVCLMNELKSKVKNNTEAEEIASSALRRSRRIREQLSLT